MSFANYSFNLKALILSLGLPILSLSVNASPLLNSVVVHSKAYQNNPELQALLRPYLGQEINAKLLQNILDEVSHYYQEKGFYSSQAYYPDQSTTQGVITVEVAHPRLGEVNINNLSTLNSYAEKLLFKSFNNFEEQYFDEEALQNHLYRLSDLNAFSLNASYAETKLDDTVSLDLDINKIKPVNYLLFVDNYGTKASGKIRGGGQVQFNNITKSADNLSLFYARSNEKQNNFSLSYEIPVSSHPTLLGSSVCLSNYELGSEYKVLGAKGKALSYDLYLKEPLYRSSNSKLQLTLGTEYNKLSDEFEVFDLEFKKHSLLGYLSLGGAHNANKIYLRGEIKTSLGNLKNDDDYKLYKEGGFSIFNFDGSLAYKYSDYVEFKDNLIMQLGSKELDSSERFIAGGAQRVSAYDSNVSSGDSGIFNSTILQLKPLKALDLFVSPHFDSAYVKSSDYDGLKLFGAGLSLNFKHQGFFVNSSLDFPIGHLENVDEDNFKIFVRTGYIYA